MVELTRTDSKNPLPLTKIAANAGISLSYLEQLVSGLRRHGLVKSYRGPGGGYLLNKSADEIMITDILRASEDNAPAKRKKTKTGKTNPCEHTHALWEHIGRILSATLCEITLHDVLHNQLEHHPHARKLFETIGKIA
ncbi:MAG: Rrf2 family transcriptional regulator [Rhodospirillales bacterium]|nr:MAG: Rrf2 family transcriptional regulator [Rhodospirillales bacterium]